MKKKKIKEIFQLSKDQARIQNIINFDCPKLTSKFNGKFLINSYKQIYAFSQSWSYIIHKITTEDRWKWKSQKHERWP